MVRRWYVREKSASCGFMIKEGKVLSTVVLFSKSKCKFTMPLWEQEGRKDAVDVQTGEF